MGFSETNRTDRDTMPFLLLVPPTICLQYLSEHIKTPLMSVRTGPSRQVKYEQCQNNYKGTGQKLLKHIALIINS